MTVPELTLEAALKQLTAQLPPKSLDRTDQVKLADASQRFLAAAPTSRVDQPAFDNAAMDGYALHADAGTDGMFKLSGRVLAGETYRGRLDRGQCVRIMTGAPVPDGADRVAMQEDCRVDGDRVLVDPLPRAGVHIRRRGEHLRTGASLLAAGRQLGPAEIGLLASAGVAEVLVWPRLRVGLLSTGDELQDPPTPLHAAATYDANRPFMQFACRTSGFETHDLGICPDQPDRLQARLQLAVAGRLDAVIISGGGAQGDVDVVRQATAMTFVPLAVRPGRGISCGWLNDGAASLLLLGLPGNAVAAYLLLYLLALPLLRQLAGGRAQIPRGLAVPLAEAIQHRPGRIDYWRGVLERDAQGSTRVRPLPAQGSAMLKTLTDADVLLAVGPQASYAAGEPIEALPLSMLNATPDRP